MPTGRNAVLELTPMEPTRGASVSQDWQACLFFVGQFCPFDPQLLCLRGNDGPKTALLNQTSLNLAWRSSNSAGPCL
jgi:hypothetical protein